jgi:hypothetical protein
MAGKTNLNQLSRRKFIRRSAVAVLPWVAAGGVLAGPKKSAAPGNMTLRIDKIVMHETPQSDGWFICIEAAVGEIRRRFHVAGDDYHGKEVAISTDLALPGVRSGQKCAFVCQLDDTDENVCGDGVDNRSTGSFIVSARGSQGFKPEDNWSYTLHWSLRPSTGSRDAALRAK